MKHKKNIGADTDGNIAVRSGEDQVIVSQQFLTFLVWCPTSPNIFGMLTHPGLALLLLFFIP